MKIAAAIALALIMAGCASKGADLSSEESYYRAARMLQDSGQAPATEAQCREEYSGDEMVDFEGRSHRSLDVCLGVSNAYYSGNAEAVGAETFKGERNFISLLQDVMPKDPSSQRVIADALENYEIYYDRIDDEFTLRPALTTSYTNYSYAAIVVDFDSDRAMTSHLRIEYQGATWLFAKAATIHVDGRNWEFRHLPFAKYNGSRKAYETASILLDGEGREAAEAMARGRDVLVRFYGENGSYDMNVSEKEKADIGRMLRAVSLFNK